MKSLIRGIVLASVVLALLMGTFFALISQERVVSTQEVVFSSYAPTEIVRLTVQNAAGGFEVYLEGDGYVVDDIPSEYVDLESFVAFMTRAGAVSALKQIDRPGDFSLYGLDAPQAQAVIEYEDGKSLSLNIGNQDPVSGNYYLQADGKDAVYLLSKEVAEGFLVDKRAYMDHHVTPQLTVTSPLSAIRDVTLTGKDWEEPIVITAVSGADEDVQLQALSFGAVTHLVSGEGVYELDQTYGIEILGSILDIVALEIVDYNVTDEQFAAYGFEQPDLQVQFTLSGGEEYLLRLVEDGDGFLANITGKNVIYRIARPAFADVQYEKLMLRYFLSPLLLDITGVTVEFDEEIFEIDYQRISNSEQSATLNGQDVEIDQFQAFYRLITSAAADGEYLPGTDPSGEPVLSITYHYANAQKKDDVLRLYPGSTRRLLVEVNGACEFDIRENFATRVREGIASLESGNAVEETW